MNNPPTFQPLRVSRLMALPPELRRRVYYFAIIEPHPLPLMTHRFGGKANGYSVKRDLRMLNTCEEFRTEMSDLLYSENSFTYAIPRHEAEEHTQSSKVDLKRVQKCYIPIEGGASESPNESEPQFPNLITEDERFLDDLMLFVTTLAFNRREMKHVLIECESTDFLFLADGLGLLLFPKNIGLVHFRYRPTATMYSCRFRFWEASMMGDYPVPWGNRDAWEVGPVGRQLLDCPEKSRLVKDLDDDKASAVVRSQEQLEGVAKELYSILGVEGDFTPWSEMERYFLVRISTLNPIGLS